MSKTPVQKQKNPILFRPNAQCGASLLEGIAYLGIAAIVILGAVSLLTNAFGNAQTNRTLEEVISVRTAVRKLYMAQASSYGTAAITGSLISAGAFPATLLTDANAVTVTNTWGGTVTVTGSNNGNTFTLTYTQVPRDVCIGVISGASGWQSISGANGANAIAAFPASTAAANTLCNAANNTIEFVAR